MSASRRELAQFPNPLCRRYRVVLICDAHLPTREQGRARVRVFRWGLGALPNGELDSLGVWDETDHPERSIWHSICTDLRARGVDKVDTFSGTDPRALRAAASAAFPSGDVLQEEDPSSLVSLPRSRRDAVHRARRVASEMNRSIGRAGARRAEFTSRKEARTFLFRQISQVDAFFAAAPPKRTALQSTTQEGRSARPSMRGSA